MPTAYWKPHPLGWGDLNSLFLQQMRDQKNIIIKDDEVIL